MNSNEGVLQLMLPRYNKQKQQQEFITINKLQGRVVFINP
jgi:hypothetical protein